MRLTLRAAIEAAAWAFAGTLLALSAVFILGGVSVPSTDFAALAAALGVVGGITASGAVTALVRARFPGKSPVVGARRGAAIGVLVVVVVPAAAVCLGFGSRDVLHSLLGLTSWSVAVAGLPFAAAGAVLGRSMEKRFFSARGD